MIKNVLLGILVLLVLARLFASSIGGIATLDENSLVPEFSLATLEGKDKLTNKDIEKGIALVTFMSYACPYCTKQSQYISENGFPIPVYLISADTDVEGVQSWVKENNIKPYYKKFGVLGNKLGRDFGVNGVPTSFIIKDGVIVKKFHGMIDAGRMPVFTNILNEIKSNK